ncbi:MAG: hypothetical protein LLG09_01740 [Negativicutes bacterium]|nr:hypothetical protein [Negativicutes bacterium]
MKEILRQVKDAEQEAAATVEKAKIEAEELIFHAKTESALKLEKTIEEARAEAERLLSERKTLVEEKLQSISLENQETRRQIVSGAEQHIPEAIALIKERMVKRVGNR